MEPLRHQPSALFPNIASQIRVELSSLRLAASRLIPDGERERNPALDAQAALMDQSYYRLLRLVNLLSAAASLSEEGPVTLQNRDLVDFVGDICARAGGLAPLLGLELRFSCALPRHICAVNPESLEQLLYHLLSNAFKFTPRGGAVTVELRVQGERTLLSVSDTGCGIPAEHLSTLFGRYLQTGLKDPPPHGIGLGLSLCSRIAESHGGSLMAESCPGKGSRFTLSLSNRLVDGSVSDVPFDYAGGFNRTLLALADALPSQAFLLRCQD